MNTPFGFTIERAKLSPALCLAALVVAGPLRGEVIFDKVSPYHHVQVIDDAGTRMLSFNGTRETMMRIANPLEGHFEYTEYFHTAWLWNHDLKKVLMLGLGGGSTQRSFQHYYTNVMVETVELDPVVVEVAKKYFTVTETPRLKIHNEDGRVFLRRSTNSFDAIFMDAYTTTRYGSSIPPHLTTKEFFMLANNHLTTNGVLAYNVIGQIQGWKADIVGGIYRTLKEVFPQVYMFPAKSSMNVVLVATKSPQRFDSLRVVGEGTFLVTNKVVRLPTFYERLQCFIAAVPPAAATSPVLTDDHAPVEGLMKQSP